VNQIENYFNEGKECLKAFEWWSRHQDLVKYERVLESWDDKVCDFWEPPDETNLNVDDWIADIPIVKNKSQYIKDYLDNSFKNIELYMKNFHKYLEKVHDNENINFDMIVDEKLKNSAECVTLILKWFHHQIEEFEEYLPAKKDLGMLWVDFGSIKTALKPKPQECFDKIKKRLPPEIKWRVEDCWKWIH